MTRVVLTRRAIADLADIDACSTEVWGSRVAGEYLSGFDAALALLAHEPGLLDAKPEVSGRLLLCRVERH